MGFNKTFASLGGLPVIAHSIAAFAHVPSVAQIVVVGRAERIAALEELLRLHGGGKGSVVVPGGVRRQDSVARGLAQVRPTADFVAVHDAARPLVRPELIERVLAGAQAHGGAASAAPVVDTLKRVDRDRFVVAGVERENLFAVQTPQIFRRDLLEKAYAAVEADGVEVTDEISAVERMGGRVLLLPNEQPNFKITYPADLALAESILRACE